MIATLIRWSLHNRLLVLIATAIAVAWGLWALRSTPLDAIPDLSDTQVIVRTTWPGQAPQVVEDQVTYPLTTTMLSVPGAKTVRGYSMFGESFVHVLFDDGVDLYWARSRVLESLSQVRGRLPADADTALGPDATGVGWVYSYALVDRSGTHDLAQLRSLQDWFLRFELGSLPGVAEVATVGGFERQTQVVVDPNRLRAFGIDLERVVQALRDANGEAGGAIVELGEAEYMVRTRGYLRTLADFREIGIAVADDGVPVQLADIADVREGPALRRGIAELDGEGEVVGGIVVMRAGGNAVRTIAAVEARLGELQAGLPDGVEIVTTYDRSALIERAVTHLQLKLVEEFIVVALVCAAFLFHLRSALVAVVALPVGVLVAFIVMHLQGISANIMSLGGIAIAIGAMVDAAVVMVENAHKHLEREPGADAGRRRQLIADAATEVGPALFFSLLVITVSFVPVFALQAQEGRLFAPLAYTKTYAMAAAAGLSVTLVPVLMQLFVRGRIRDEARNPLNRALIAVYRPAIRLVLRHPWATILLAGVALAISLWPVTQLGSEFIPPLDEGDLLYMPSTLPGVSPAKAAELLQQSDRIIRRFPEVARVFGKAGRADTATDPAPLSMIETTIQLRPREEWRPGMTPQRLVEELDAALDIPGVGNVWVQPIRNRIDMLATGIKSPVGIKIAGPDLEVIAGIAADVEAAVQQVPGTASAFAERVTGGRYLQIEPDRTQLARHGLSIAQFNRIVAVAIGGQTVAETVDGLARYPISVRYPRAWRDSPAALRALPIVTAGGQTLTLDSVARVDIVDGPPMIKSENARPAAYVFVDIRERDLGAYVADARAAVDAAVQLPPGYSLSWSGQFEYLERATERLRLVVPLTLAIIFVLLLMAFGRASGALLIMGTLPLALIGGLWLVWALGHAVSVATVIGFIALAGVAAEFGVVMLIYLDAALQRTLADGQVLTRERLDAAIIDGAVQRVRPKAMTVAVIVAGLLPMFWGAGAGAEVMQRIAAPMVGGMASAPLLSMLVLPAAYRLVHGRRLRD